MDTSLYKELPYIIKELDDSYIELTNLNITENSKLYYKGVIFNYINKWGAPIIGSGYTTYPFGMFVISYDNENIKFNFGEKNFYISKDKYDINNILEIEFTPNGYIKLNNQIFNNATNTIFESRHDLIIAGALLNAGYFSIKQYIYRIKLYEDGTTLSYDFIPCKRLSDNVVGLYDNVHNKFYPPKRGRYYEPLVIDNVTAIQIPEGNVTKIEDKEGKILWANINKAANIQNIIL